MVFKLLCFLLRTTPKVTPRAVVWLHGSYRLRYPPVEHFVKIQLLNVKFANLRIQKIRFQNLSNTVGNNCVPTGAVIRAQIVTKQALNLILIYFVFVLA